MDQSQDRASSMVSELAERVADAAAKSGKIGDSVQNLGHRATKGIQEVVFQASLLIALGLGGAVVLGVATMLYGVGQTKAMGWRR